MMLSFRMRPAFPAATIGPPTELMLTPGFCSTVSSVTSSSRATSLELLPLSDPPNGDLKNITPVDESAVKR